MQYNVFGYPLQQKVILICIWEHPGTVLILVKLILYLYMILYFCFIKIEGFLYIGSFNALVLCLCYYFGCQRMSRFPMSIIFQGQEKVLTIERNSVLRTLKDHLYQCPSKLSEEMVRCMAAVYCWLGSAASENLEKKRSSILSRSSTNVIPPMVVIGEDQGLSCKSMVEICWIPTDKSHFSRASFAINNYR